MANKRHHYVPQFYLNGFIDNNNQSEQTPYLWVLEEQDGSFYKKSPKNICWASHFYRDEGKGVFNKPLEHKLSQLESRSAKLLKMIRSKKEIPTIPTERFLLAEFVSVLNHRTMRAKELTRIISQNVLKQHFVDQLNKAGGYEEYKQLHDKEGRLKNIGVEDFLQSFNGMKINPTQDNNLTLMLEFSEKMIPYLLDRNWALMRPEDIGRCFITCDHPVLLNNTQDNDVSKIPGLALKETNIIFPICSDLCLMMSYFVKDGFQRVCSDDVVLINRLLASNSHKYIFASTNNYEMLFEFKRPS